MNARSIDVLLATYNGEKYLEEQIESLFAQTCTDFRVIARDDGSRDNTRTILNSYHQKYGERFLVVEDELPGGSAKKNFARLTQLSDADYTMYCDQDDYWEPEKIEMTLAAMRKTEAGGKSIPILVHSDLKVVDSNRSVISRSLWVYQGLNPDINDTNHLVVQNNITGCAMMINRALRERALPFPDGIIMHDWWLGLVASVTGKIFAINEPLIEYRQHGANDTGAKNYNIGYVMRRASKIFTRERLDEFRKTIVRSKVQAQVLLDALGADIPADERILLETYVRLDQQGPLARRYFVLRNGFYKQGLARNMAYLLSL